MCGPQLEKYYDRDKGGIETHLEVCCREFRGPPEVGVRATLRGVIEDSPKREAIGCQPQIDWGLRYTIEGSVRELASELPQLPKDGESTPENRAWV
jgi:hypothetical protein